MKTSQTLACIFGIILVAIIIVAIVLGTHHQAQIPVAATQPAQTQQPTGVTIPAGWQTSTDPQSGLSFSYPTTLPETYIHIPVSPVTSFELIDQPFSCNVGGSSITTQGQTVAKTINGSQYRVTTQSEGAAGTTYNTYTYATARGNQTMRLTFTLGYVQCENYDEPQTTACKNEQTSFSVDNLADQMMQTVQ